MLLWEATDSIISICTYIFTYIYVHKIKAVSINAHTEIHKESENHSWQHIRLRVQLLVIAT